MTRSPWRLCALLFLGFWTQGAKADQVPIGVFSYDPFQYNSSGNLITTAFNVSNYTGNPAQGGFALPPDFNIFTFLSISNATLTLQGSSAPLSPISIGNIGPGPLLDQSGNPLSFLQFAGNSSFTSALLRGTLSATSVTLADGSILTLDPTVSVLLGPSTGTSLVPGTDFVVIDASTAVATVPEPSSIILFACGFLAMGLAKLFLIHRATLQH